MGWGTDPVFVDRREDALPSSMPVAPTAVDQSWGANDQVAEDQSIWSKAGSAIGGAWEALPDVVQEPAEDVGSGLMWGLHQLGRPQSGVAAGIENIVEQAGKEEGEDDRSLWDRYVWETIDDMGKGVTYEKERRIQDVIAQGNPEWVRNHPVWSTILGFAGDVVTDPLNLLGVGLVRHAIHTPIKGLAKVINSTETGKRLADMADNPVLRAFNIHTGDKVVARELWLQYLDNLQGSYGAIKRNVQVDKIALKDIAKKLGVSVDDLERQILREAEGVSTAAKAEMGVGLTGAASAVAKQEAEDMSRMFKGFLETEQSPRYLDPSGSPVVQRVEPTGTQDLAARFNTVEDLETAVAEGSAVTGYVPHILSAGGRKKLEKQLQKEGFLTMRDVFRNHPNMLQRKLPGTIEDANLKYGDNFFLTDTSAIKGIRGARHAYVVAGQNFLKETAETLGRRADLAPANWVPIKGIQGVKFEPEIAEMVTKMYKTIHDPKELSKMLRMFDGATRWWKMWSLGLRPAYHARNVVGNVWNAYNIGGMSNPVWFGRASKIQKQATVPTSTTRLGAQAQRLGEASGMGQFRGSTSLGKYGTVKNETIWQEAMEDGVFNRGQYGGDMVADLARYGVDDAPKSAGQRLSAWLAPTTKNKVLKGGFATGTALENNARLALYMHTLSKTGSRSAARANVKKSLFDYNDLSPFEQNTMKRMLPFYTWSRKNIPAQIEALIKNPQRAGRVEHMVDNIQWGIDTPSPDEVGEYMMNRNPVFIDKFMGEDGAKDVHNIVTLMNWLPIADVDRLLDWKPVRGGDTEYSKFATGGAPFPTLIAEMTNPFLKSTFEYIMNYDIYRRRDIKDYKDKKVDFLGVRMPVHLAKAAQNLVMLSEFDRLNPFDVFGKSERLPSGKVERGPARFQVPWEEEPTERESRVDAPMSVRLMQYLVGLRPYEVKADAKKWEKLGVVKDYKQLQKLLTKALRQQKPQEADAIRKLLRNTNKVVGD